MAVIATLALILAAVFVVCCGLLAAFIGSLLYMVVLNHRLRAKGLEREEDLLATPLPPDAQLPHVVIQIPSFNEGPVLRRGVEAAARLDWPRDKLHIQLLDDSTDKTAEIAREVTAELRAKGFDVVALQRTDRSGFKGGALHEAMQQTSHNYFAVFDVDYVPPEDFLRRCMRVFVAEPKTAFVQARFDFLNPHENALTEMQMVTLDAHLGIEQATRYWAGHPLPFNGTCGIWQREAIEAGGGWKGDTVTEDLDLTYRGWVKGWRSVFLVSVSVPGELPADMKTWLR
ncbi:MAG: glycosyltransferase, partial [Proteobacteria bacterium]|nr:glycosyltransferase [Pseudomonadota bacterium]